MLKAVASQACKASFAYGFAFVMAAACLVAPLPSFARGPAPTVDSTTVALAELPVQARKTYALIREGGPFPFDKDGSAFGNRERQLPKAKRGYYREYTVKTPGSRDRGARRIVCGGPALTPDACFYTNDHYTSFREIQE